jgi:hypothetical protein
MAGKETNGDVEIQRLIEDVEQWSLKKATVDSELRKLKGKLRKALKKKIKKNLPSHEVIKRSDQRRRKMKRRNEKSRAKKRNREEKRKEDDKAGIPEQPVVPRKKIKFDDDNDDNEEDDNINNMIKLSKKMEELVVKKGDKEVEKQILVTEEIDNLIDKYEDKPTPPTYKDTILLKEPNDEDLFIECLEDDRKKRKKELVVANYQTYSNYWFNHITCFDDVKKVLDDVIKLEQRKTRVKISTTFGMNYEMYEIEPETNMIRYKYHVYSPNDVDEANRHIINLIDKNEIEKYKKYLEARIRDTNEISSHLDSKTLYVPFIKYRLIVGILLTLEEKELVVHLFIICAQIIMRSIMKENMIYAGFQFTLIINIIFWTKKRRHLIVRKTFKNWLLKLSKNSTVLQIIVNVSLLKHSLRNIQVSDLRNHS